MSLLEGQYTPHAGPTAREERAFWRILQQWPCADARPSLSARQLVPVASSVWRHTPASSLSYLTTNRSSTTSQGQTPTSSLSTPRYYGSWYDTVARTRIKIRITLTLNWRHNTSMQWTSCSSSWRSSSRPSRSSSSEDATFISSW